MRKLSSDEVERTLSDRASYNVQTLRAIAAQLGLRTQSKATRLSIVEKITKTLANRRGYQYLREGAHGGEKIGDLKTQGAD